MSLDTGTAATAATVAASIFNVSPKKMPLIAATSLTIKNGQPINLPLSSATALTVMARGGAAAALVAINTYATVCDLAGAGFLTLVVSSKGAAAHTPIFRITVDGTVFTITPSAALGAGYRMVLGTVLSGFPVAVGGAATAAMIMGYGEVYDTGFGNVKAGGLPVVAGDVMIIRPDQALSAGFPSVRFETSLKVEIAADAYAAGDPSSYGAALYVLDTV